MPDSVYFKMPVVTKAIKYFSEAQPQVKLFGLLILAEEGSIIHQPLSTTGNLIVQGIC